ncbi:MAG: 4Fe-4S binding protein, partial [Acholeplasmatales bacterium]|nr:4Fe-4S binding protein [Acholeplasmatales bacterium]
MWSKIKNFFVRITPSKRKIIQLYAALLYNANIKGFISGEIFTGNVKYACLPGLNCYSCPGAVGACPLGSLQNALAASKTKLPTYIIGIILLYSIILGRTICGWLCPVGLLQEWLYKIKSPKVRKSNITRVLSYFKYVLLVTLVIVLPLIYGLQSKEVPLPAFCKYICPAGTFEGAIFLLSNPNNTDFFGMLGSLFTWKFLLLIVFAVAAVFIYRFFCRFFCPLGAIYGLFNKISILGVKVDKSKCNHCQACINHCKMDVKVVGDHECIQCGECRDVCHANAINWKTIGKIVKEDEVLANANEEVVVDVDLEANKPELEEALVEIKKKDRRLTKKTWNIVTGSIMGAVLVAVICIVNFGYKALVVNDVVESIEITMIDDTEYNYTESEKSTLLYFYKDLTLDELSNIKNFAIDGLDIVLVSPYNSEINNVIKDIDNSSHKFLTKELYNELKSLNIKFAFDTTKASALKLFTNKKDYPYSVFTDFSDKILITKAGFISADDYFSIVIPSASGLTVGNNVGDICINKDINLVGSDDKFSVLDNRGKITVINFWYTSCTPCVKELPHFDKLAKEYSDDVTVIAIHDSTTYNEENCIQFIKNQFD